MPIRHGPEEEAEEAVEETGHDGQEVAHRRDHVGQDEADAPDERSDADPSSPAFEGVRVQVLRAGQGPSEQVLRGDVGIDRTNDWRRGDLMRHATVSFSTRNSLSVGGSTNAKELFRAQPSRREPTPGAVCKRKERAC